MSGAENNLNYVHKNPVWTQELILLVCQEIHCEITESKHRHSYLNESRHKVPQTCVQHSDVQVESDMGGFQGEFLLITMRISTLSSLGRGSNVQKHRVCNHIAAKMWNPITASECGDARKESSQPILDVFQSNPRWIPTLGITTEVLTTCVLLWNGLTICMAHAQFLWLFISCFWKRYSLWIITVRKI